jgi:hypothetical protein
MSPALLRVIPKWHAILKMDSNPARFDWMQLPRETNSICYRRRRAWLLRAGCDDYLCTRAWDRLSANVREKLSGVSA